MKIVANSPTATIPTVKRPYRNALYFRRLKSKSGTFPTLLRWTCETVNPAMRIAPAMKQTTGTEMLVNGHVKPPSVKVSFETSQPYVCASINPNNRLERPRVTRVTPR